MGFLFIVVPIILVVIALRLGKKDIVNDADEDLHPNLRQIGIKKIELIREEQTTQTNEERVYYDENKNKHEYRLFVVGNKYRGQNAQSIYDDLENGSIVSLKLEPNNKYDSNAIKVIANGVHIGYVFREHNKQIAYDMRRGLKFEAHVNNESPNLDLVSYPINFDSVIKDSTYLKGKNVAIVGNFLNLSKDDIKALIEVSGGTHRHQINSNTTDVVFVGSDFTEKQGERIELLHSKREDAEFFTQNDMQRFFSSKFLDYDGSAENDK